MDFARAIDRAEGNRLIVDLATRDRFSALFCVCACRYWGIQPYIPRLSNSQITFDGVPKEIVFRAQSYGLRYAGRLRRLIANKKETP